MSVISGDFVGWFFVICIAIGGIGVCRKDSVFLMVAGLAVFDLCVDSLDWHCRWILERQSGVRVDCDCVCGVRGECGIGREGCVHLVWIETTVCAAT